MTGGPSLGAAASFAVLGGTTVTNTGATSIVGDVGVSPGTSITGLTSANITDGGLHPGDTVAMQAEADLATAYGDLAADPYLPADDLSGQNLGGLILTPGVYHFETAAQLDSTALTLDAQGDPNAVFIFQIGTTLTTATSSSVTLINNAHAGNVFWQVGSSATLGLDTALQGSILAFTSITMNTGASIGPGRALAIHGAVTLDTNSVVFASPLTITADNQTQVYGDPQPTLTASDTGFVDGDTSLSLTTQPTLSTTARANSPVGTYPIFASGAVDGNYSITYVAGTLTITKASLTISTIDQTKGYGDALPPLMAGYTGFVNGDTFLNLEVPPTITTTAISSSDVGDYPITASGAVDSNYTISYDSGFLTITPVGLTISADDQTRVAGGPLPNLKASYTGLVNGDTSSNLTTLPGLSTTATINDNVAGSIFPITVSGAVDPNYTISYASGQLFVTPAAATQYIIVGAIDGPAGTSRSFTVTAEDQFGNVDTNDTGTAHFTSNDPLATLPADAMLSEGEGTFAVTFMTAGTDSITATDTAVGSITATDTGVVTTTISGTVYLDLNAGGTLDTGEPGLAGRVVFLDLNHDGTFDPGDPTTTTDVDGHFSFTGVTMASVSVVEATDQDTSSRYVVDQTRVDPNGTVTIGVVPISPVAPVVVVPNPFSLSPAGDANTAFVQSLYKAVLGRVGSNGEVASWLDRMNSGVGRSAVASGFVNSLEHRQDQVAAYYEEFLHRAPDSFSAFWVNALQSGVSEETIALAILDSDEYQGAHPDQAQFVSNLYVDVLGRQGDSSGEANWQVALTGGATRDEVVADFVQSTEAVDQIVDSFYTAFLHRQPESGTSGVWTTILKSPTGSATDVAVDILASNEFEQDAVNSTL